MINSAFKRIPAEAAKTLIDKGATIADIRDPDSFARGHIKGALHISNLSIQAFIEANDLDKPIVVCCFHGNSSQSAAQYLCEQGFEEVYSLDGGFEVWNQQFPEMLESE